MTPDDRYLDVENTRIPTSSPLTPVEPSPELSEGVKERIRALVTRYPQRRTALLPALKLAQAEVGYLPAGITAQVANLVGVPHAAAHELVTFYTMLRTVQEGATRVVVCAQLPCALRGANRLIQQLSDRLAIQPGETTPDGAVTLERTSECFGACSRAPMALVNDEYWENLTPEATDRLISHLALESRKSSRGDGASARASIPPAGPEHGGRKL